MHLADLEIPARAEYVSLARLVVSSIADDRYELSDDQLDNLKLAVSEACVLAIESSNDETTPVVALSCEGTDDHLDVFVDTGRQLQAVAKLTAAAPNAMNGGTAPGHDLGLPLIGSLVDDVGVAAGEHGDQLRMRIFCTRAEEL
jgi:serine/threonine-protein kinase RsbW